MEALELGVTSSIGAVGWAAIFWFVSLVIGLAVTLWCRRTLKRVARPAGMVTFMLVLGLCVVAPMLGANAGCGFAAQRSLAAGLEQADLGKVLSWTIERGATLAREALDVPPDDQAVVEIERLRTLARQRKADRGDRLTEVLEHAWWWALDHLLERAVPERLTWGVLLDRLAQELRAKVHGELAGYAEDLRASARNMLLIYAGLLLLANGLAVFFTRRAAVPGGHRSARRPGRRAR